MNHRPHIIAAKLPSGDQLTSARSTAPDGSANQSRHPSNVDLERLYASYADDRPDLYRALENETERADELVAQWRESLNADLRIIGYGLAAAYLFVVVFRIAQGLS